ncbi:MAG TPA: hypothetical protein VFM33_03840 [Aquabacterium sp.]|nr:hypothetical protein [Aquabacterium sp.]
MDLDGTTFALQIVNFLALLWLLNRFVFRPIRAAVQAKAEAEAAQRQALLKQAADLEAQRAQLAQQLAEGAAQRAKAQAALNDEIQALRKKQMQSLHEELQDERDKARARLQQEEKRLLESMEARQQQCASDYIAAYLSRLASPELEARIIALFLTDLDDHASDAAQALANPWQDDPQAPAPVEVSTCFQVDAATRTQIEDRLHRLCTQPCLVSWRQNPALLAGICVHVPGFQLEASLRAGVRAAPSSTARAPS